MKSRLKEKLYLNIRSAGSVSPLQLEWSKKTREDRMEKNSHTGLHAQLWLNVH